MRYPIRAAAVASLSAAAVLLSACTSGTSATPGTTPSATSTSVTASPTASSGVSSSEADTAPTTSGRLVTGTTSGSLSSRSSQPVPSTPEPSGTNAVGSFDAQTVRYFAALCSGLQDKPADAFAQLSGSVEERRTKAVALFDQQAERLDGAASAMKAAGAPNVPSGDKIASVTIATYPKMADAARGGAKLLSSVVSNEELTTQFAAARQLTDDAAAPLADLSEIIGAPAVVGQMKKISACTSVLNG